MSSPSFAQPRFPLLRHTQRFIDPDFNTKNNHPRLGDGTVLEGFRARTKMRLLDRKSVFFFLNSRSKKREGVESTLGIVDPTILVMSNP